MNSKPVIIRKTLPASLVAVDAMCEELEKNLIALGKSEQAFACDLLLREMLLNAVYHGCGNVSEKNFKCKISIGSTEIQLTIKDYGKGFDRKLWLPPACDAEKESGRGLMIIYRYADHYRFNASGNCISVKKRVCA